MNKNFKNTTKKISDRKGKDAIYNISSKVTKKELDWICNTNIDFGISKMIDFTKKNYNEIKNLSMEYHK